MAVFASGNGSNFENIVQAVDTGRLTGAEVSLLVTDRPSARCVERANRLGVPVFAFEPKSYPSKEACEAEIVFKLQAHGISLVVLAGYMRLVGPTLLNAYQGRMINLHPSLLPAFAGKDAVGQALAYGVKVTGVTVHIVDSGLDSGPIIAQIPVRVEPNDTHQSLTEKIHAVERQLLVEVVQDLVLDRIRIKGRTTHKLTADV
nr:phosphoribosylglycinamide formyltransferase [Brevibacillus fulvus]